MFLVFEAGGVLPWERSLLDFRLMTPLGLEDWCFEGESGTGWGTLNSKDLRVEIWVTKGFSA